MTRRVQAVIAVALVAALAPAGTALGAAAPDRGTQRISTDTGPAEANNASHSPSVSADGRWVAFVSEASNLVPHDINRKQDVFLRDTRTGRTVRVSVSSKGQQGNMPSYNPSISDDGRFVVFDSFASNLVRDDLNRRGDVFLYDRRSATTERISVGPGGAEATGHSGFASISGDGNVVVFESTAKELRKGGGRVTDVYALGRRSGKLDWVSRAPLGGEPGGGSGNATVSRDGRFVAFTSGASNLVPGDANQAEDVFVRDRRSGFTVRASMNSVGGEANAGSDLASISDDGRFVAFESTASSLTALDPTSELVPGLLRESGGIGRDTDTNAVLDVFVHDLRTRRTERISVAHDGAQGTRESYSPSISGDGRYVAFASYADNLVPGDTNRAREVFLRDRVAGTTTRASVGAADAQANAGSSAPAMTADGRGVVFVSDASNLVTGDRNHEADVFVHRGHAGSAP